MLNWGEVGMAQTLLPGIPEELWKQYIAFTEVEQAFKKLENDLGVRPVYHRQTQPDPARPTSTVHRRAKKEIWGGSLIENGANTELLPANRERR